MPVVSFDIPEAEMLLDNPNKKRLTPHPNKKQRIHTTDNAGVVNYHDCHDDDDDDDENHPRHWQQDQQQQQCLDSPNAAKTTRSTFTTIMTTTTAEDKVLVAAPPLPTTTAVNDDIITTTTWNSTIDQIAQDKTSDAYKNLVLFQKGLERFETSQQQLTQVFEEEETETKQDSCTGMNKLQSLVQKAKEIVMETYYNQQMERLTELQKDIAHVMTHNHVTRTKLLQKLSQTKCAMDFEYDKLAANILQQQQQQQHHNTRVVDSSEQQQVVFWNNNDDDEDDKNHDNDGMEDDDHDTNSTDDAEPNWEELAQYEPSRANVELFLDARNTLQAAEERLAAAIDHVDKQFQLSMNRFENLISEVFENITTPLDELQLDIQEHMTSNLERRKRFELLIQEQAQQAHGIFARLMSSVSSIKSPLFSFHPNKKNNAKE